jgi:hypothetical protein
MDTELGKGRWKGKVEPDLGATKASEDQRSFLLTGASHCGETCTAREQFYFLKSLEMVARKREGDNSEIKFH